MPALFLEHVGRCIDREGGAGKTEAARQVTVGDQDGASTAATRAPATMPHERTRDVIAP